MSDKAIQTLKKSLYILLFIMPFFFIKRTMDTDFWFMASHGRYLMESGFPTTEILTVHSEYAFQLQKWLTCLLFYQIYIHFGPVGMYVFLYIASLLTEVLMYKLLKYVSNNTFISIVTTSFSMVMLNFAFMVTRPQVFSYIFILAEIYLLERYVKTDDKVNLILLPVVSVLYMQFHSTQWIMLFIILLCYLCDFSLIKIDRIDSGETKKVPIIVSGIAMFIIGIVNPYGIHTFEYIFRSLSDTSHTQGISECMPATYQTVWIFAPGAILFVYGLWKNKTIKLRYMYLALGTLLMGLLANRNEAYTILGMSVAAVYLWKEFNVEEDKKKAPQYIIPLLMGCILASMVGLSATTNPPKSHDADIIDVANAIRANVEPSRDVKIHTTLNTGAYVEWLGYTGYIDARTEVFAKSINKTEDTLNEERSFLNGYILVSDMTEKYGFDYYIIPRGEAVNFIFANDNYPLMYQNDSFIVYGANRN